MDKEKRSTDEESFEAFVDSVDTSDIDSLIDQEDIPGSRKRETHSALFSDAELDAMPSYTEEELAALPKPWTRRGVMLPDDRGLIWAITDKNRAAARIFVTGEVLESYIGEAAVNCLLASNDTCYENGAGDEPLFVETRNETVRMTRFDPEFVWRCFHPDTLVGLVQDEIARLGVDMDPWKMDYFDFYQNMVAAHKVSYGEDTILVKPAGSNKSMDDFYHGIYFASLLLFGKPGYMDVPVAEHFAQEEAVDFLRTAVFLQLDTDERKKLDELRKEYGTITALTNPEMHYIVALYERLLQCAG